MSDPEAPRDEASADETELPTETSPEAETEFSPFSDLSDEFKPSPGIYHLDAEGMAVTMDETTESDIPRLSTTTLVCMEDRSAFVVRGRWGEVLLTFTSAEQTPSGDWRVPWADAVRESSNVIAAYRSHASSLANGASDDTVLATILALSAPRLARVQDWLLVEPVRPACKHYVRQRVAFDLNAQHSEYKRLCAARRTTEGTFMSVRDMGLWACDMREPQDYETVRALDAFDEMKIEQGKNRTHLPLVAGGGGGPGGIFDSKGRG